MVDGRQVSESARFCRAGGKDNETEVRDGRKSLREKLSGQGRAARMQRPWERAQHGSRGPGMTSRPSVRPSLRSFYLSFSLSRPADTAELNIRRHQNRSRELPRAASRLLSVTLPPSSPLSPCRASRLPCPWLVSMVPPRDSDPREGLPLVISSRSRRGPHTVARPSRDGRERTGMRG